MKPTVSIILACLIVVLTNTAYGQQKVRRVNEELHKYKNQPIKVEYIIAGRPFVNRNETLAGADWLKDLELKVTNISGKTVVYAYLLLIIEKQANMPYRYAVSATFPSGPGEYLVDSSGNKTGEYRPQVLKPGETVNIKPPPNQLEIIETVKKFGVSDIPEVSIDIHYVFFDDGTRWAFGTDYAPNPNDKGKFTPVRSHSVSSTIDQRISDFLTTVVGVSVRRRPYTRRGLMFSQAGFFSLMTHSNSPTV